MKTAPPSPDLHLLDAAQLAEAYGSGHLSPVEVTEASLARIARWEPRLNAMYKVHADAARAMARASEARWRAGAPLSPIDGVPITLKDNIATAGDPTPVGTRANAEAAPATADAPAAARVREAGAVIVGKTTMPDFGMLSSGLSSLHGVTRNPWDTTRNTSGSSSGAGAAAAAGYAPLHLGTDIGGSVRLPAVHCGIYALKPSLGRIPVYPPYLGRVVGPMTRSVRDAAMLLTVCARPDPQGRDFMNLPPAGRDYAEDLDQFVVDGVRGLRIGLMTDIGAGLPAHPEVRAAVEACAAALAARGAEVQNVPGFMTPELLDGMCRFFEARSCADFQAMTPERQAAVLPFIAEWCTWRAKAFSGTEVMTAYGQVMAMREAAVRACHPYDFMLMPVSPILPYEAELPCPGNDPHDALPHIAFTVPFSMSEQPAASLNWQASAGGLPLGVQVVGHRFDDAGVLRLSRLLETLRPAQRPWPEPA